MNIIRISRGLKAVFLATGIALFYGCVHAMSNGSLKTGAITNETLDLPVQETISNKPDLLNIASLAIIILILGLLFWKKGSTCYGNKNRQ